MQILEKAWYSGARWPWLLLPLEKLFITVSRYRRRKHQLQQWQAPVPVIVVGNINIGGTGKSPLVIALIQLLREQGYQPGVVSRGYAAHPSEYPFTVLSSSTPSEAGDEPLMIVQRTAVPLVIDPNRVRACQQLLKTQCCDIIISDDGLQHYAMGRDVEIVVIDGKRGLGNGHCLPVGPLRELPERLNQVDMVVVNGVGGFHVDNAIQMQLAATALVSLTDGQSDAVTVVDSVRVHAVAGIGNPDRFYDTLRQAGFNPIEHSFPDHHAYQLTDVVFDDLLPVIMTEKDAVKCRHLPITASTYYLKVEAQLPPEFKKQLQLLLRNLKK
ncbi:tetraacyldisaccharide 4'-kinase [Neptunomonas antarctica]|uniref:Tetraacyldisaccharide 4'-kinase n=1 Tax=Neptunomonas antarctica TaxID=619304 RepID=A0A1N7LR01_9GAMM|nr:tetraacyldisaccharide 4'-kinase [Neptunomonas antarctica]SIS76131.1 lipid-A-disaccharide kinase [Neptunomonas antarctica]